ncbi:MAG: PD-(D/E)XK nuclease family protein [Candidatus Eremiobacteraeota bacterium]|nr:PD-(D/E)XK nuclease family protein [Candidatus Eremiobacteraeota bacterium]
MSERITIEIDAAEPPVVDGSLAVPLLTFVRDLTRCTARPSERDLRRALCSPFSGLPNVDARALCVAADDRRGVVAVIASERLPLGREASLSARRFARAVDELHRVYRAQGATALEFVTTIRLAFELDGVLEPNEARTFRTLETLAARLDAGRAAGSVWEPHALLEALDDIADHTHGPRRARSNVGSHGPLALPQREREEARVVKRRRTHFSASSLGTFAQCERRWYYRYVCGAVQDRGSSASFYGTAFHWALERFHQEFASAGAAPPDVLERKLDAYVGTSFERFRSGFATNVEYELQRRRAKRTARRYLSWFVERARRHPFTVVGTETTVELALDGYAFIGYIDRLDRDDATGAITVIDYKTGSIPESAAQYRTNIAQFVDFQLPFYYWARTEAGDRVTRLALVPLKDAARDVEPIELEVVPIAAPRSYSDAPAGTIGIDELERARAKMQELAALLADGPIENFAVTDDAEACVYCAYKNACRSRPLPREDRFGR